jgi:hypothetical protein
VLCAQRGDEIDEHVRILEAREEVTLFELLVVLLHERLHDARCVAERVHGERSASSMRRAASS